MLRRDLIAFHTVIAPPAGVPAASAAFWWLIAP